MSDDGPPDVLRHVLGSDVGEDVLRAMSTREQRYVLYHLLDHEEATLGELADVVAGWIAATDRDVTTSVDRSSLRVGLYHNHLPRLAEADLIAFDPEAKAVDGSPMSEDERELVETACVAEHWTGGRTTP